MKYLSLGISVDPKYWNFKKNTPKNNCPNRDHIKKIILDKQTEYQNQMLEFKAAQRDYTASTLIQSTQKLSKVKTVHEFYTDLIAHYRATNKVGNACIYRNSFNSLKSFKNTQELDFLFSEIDLS